MDKHPDISPKIEHIKLKIQQKCKDSYDTSISEAVWIKRLRPTINRKFELNHYNVDYK